MFAPAPRSSSALRTLIRGALIAAALTMTGCKDEPGPGKLFEEDGVFELFRFDLDGSGLEEVSGSREKTFFLNFDEEAGVVQTAMCSDADSDDPNNAECTEITDSMWICQCFGYDFVEDQMGWQEFEAGGTVPIVKLGETEEPEGEESTVGETDTDGGSGGGDEEGGDEPAPAGSVHQFTVAESATEAATFDFTPLPAGIFGSDGVVSKFVFQKKASSVYAPVLENEDRPVCAPCI
ncbi:MAG: hypothetical protein ACRBN8_36840 [Nannocystales bacterium]